MKEPDFWTSLLNGLTPESKEEANLVWIVPLILILLFSIVYFLSAKQG